MMPFIQLPLAASLLFEAFARSDTFGKLIVLVQIVMSVYALKQALVLKRRLSQTIEANNRFGELLRNSVQNVITPYLERKVDAPDSPMARIYRVCCERIINFLTLEKRNSIISQARADENVALSVREVDLVARTAEHTLAEQRIMLQEGLRPLSTIATCAPLIGLFGTVWGIMVAFDAMSAKGSALLSELAPGISSALLTTIIGLIVAIGASLAHARLNAKVRMILVQCEGCTDEILGRIANELQGYGG